VRRRRVEVEVIFFDVLPVVGLAVGETEKAFLEDRVAAVPQRERKAKMLLVVGESRQAVLAPVIGAGASLVVAEVVPGISILAVVLPYRAPLPLAQVGAPLPPGDATVARLRKALLLGSDSFDGVGLCLHLSSPFVLT
jgi:hypothetical protein